MKLVAVTLVAAMVVVGPIVPSGVTPLMARMAVRPPADVFVKVILVKIFTLSVAVSVIRLSYNRGLLASPSNWSQVCVDPSGTRFTLPMPLIA